MQIRFEATADVDIGRIASAPDERAIGALLDEQMVEVPGRQPTGTQHRGRVVVKSRMGDQTLKVRQSSGDRPGDRAALALIGKKPDRLLLDLQHRYLDVVAHGSDCLGEFGPEKWIVELWIRACMADHDLTS